MHRLKELFRIPPLLFIAICRRAFKAIILFSLLGMTNCLGDSDYNDDGLYDIDLGDGQPNNIFQRFVPSGWMGDIADIEIDIHSMINPYSGEECIQIQYAATNSDGAGWSGIYWQYPENNWGTEPDGLNLSDYSRITFWARGEEGGEKAEFKIGGIAGDYPDSIQPDASFGVVELEDTWVEYEINLVGLDLSNVIGGFAWISTLRDNPNGCVIYLDDIRFVE